jgi:hypothetical protein
MTTHRLRLFRKLENMLPGKDLVTEVWDSEEEPIRSPELPSDDSLVATFSGTSIEEIRPQASAFYKQHNWPLHGDWSSRGSI